MNAQVTMRRIEIAREIKANAETCDKIAANVQELFPDARAAMAEMRGWIMEIVEASIEIENEADA